jgi:hypothetical protein
MALKNLTKILFTTLIANSLRMWIVPFWYMYCYSDGYELHIEITYMLPSFIGGTESKGAEFCDTTTAAFIRNTGTGCRETHRATQR